jgi:hypothetical protein
VQQAVKNPALAASANGGHPAIAATPRPGAFNAPGVVGARGAPPRPLGAANATNAGHINPATGAAAPAAGHPPTYANANAKAQVQANAHPQTVAAKAPAAKSPPKPAHPKPPAEERHEKE